MCVYEAATNAEFPAPYAPTESGSSFQRSVDRLEAAALNLQHLGWRVEDHSDDVTLNWALPRIGSEYAAISA